MKACRTVFLIFLSFVALLMPMTARATEPDAKGDGLYISPLRQPLRSSMKVLTVWLTMTGIRWRQTYI